MSAPASRRSAASTRAPAAINRLTMARPMPDAPPVTIAVFPWSEKCMVWGSGGLAELHRRSDQVLRTPCQEGLDIRDSDVHQPLARGKRRPCDMWGDDAVAGA